MKRSRSTRGRGGRDQGSAGQDKHGNTNISNTNKKKKVATTRRQQKEIATKERAINNDTDNKKRRSELLQDDATAAVPVAAAAATTATISSNGTLTNGISRARGGGGLSYKWELTPVSLLIRTLNYMDNDTLMIMCLVCTQIRDIILTEQGMETKLVRIFELSASDKKNEDGRRSIRSFVSNMNQYFQNVTKTRILQGFQHWKVQEMKELNNNKGFDLDRELTRLIQNIHMVGIVSLDMSSPVSIACEYGGLHRAISFMVPNLQQLDLSIPRYSPIFL